MKKKDSIRKRIVSFKFAFNGIFYMFTTQRNSLIHLFTAFVVIALGYFYNVAAIEWCLLFLAIGMVLMAEMFNTAIEFLTDLISPEYHEKAGKVKDIAAGAVLIAAMTSVVIGLIIFIPKLVGS